MKTYDYDELYPGRFLKAGNFKGREVTLTITAVDLEELEDKKGKKGKGVLSFERTKLQLVLNRTNGECLKGMFGRATAKWIGKRVTFYPVTVEAFGAPTLAIRVRGSPDIPTDLRIICHIGQQGAVSVTMKRTGVPAKAAATPAQPAAPPAPQPPAEVAPVPSSGEPPPDVPLPGAGLGLGEVPFDDEAGLDGGDDQPF